MTTAVGTPPAAARRLVAHVADRAPLGPALGALALGGFAIGTTEFVAMGLLPQVAHGVSVDVPAAGHVISAYALGWSSAHPRWPPRAATVLSFLWMAGAFGLFIVTSTSAVAAIPTVFLLGTALVLPTALQMRLMEASRGAQTLGAALNHSAFNAANALGAWLGGAVLTAGLGLAAPTWAAVVLSLAGLVVFAGAVRLERAHALA